MSLYYLGDGLRNACVLIALDTMFGDTVDWGKDFLVDLYTNEFKSQCFHTKYFYLIEESAPVIHIRIGNINIYDDQTYIYTHIYDNNNKVRYRVARNTLIMCIYAVGDMQEDGTYNGHAVAIPARELSIYARNFQIGHLFLPKYGLIVDNRTRNQDINDGIIKKQGV